MLAPSFFDTPDDRSVARELRDNGKCAVDGVAWPRFVYRIRGPMWIYTDTLTGEEFEAHGAELWKAGVWRDLILAGERNREAA